MANAAPPFSDLYFGRKDAHDEAANEPHLLIQGYYDFGSVVKDIAGKRTYLILGPKGSGKSAILEHLRLIWEDDPLRFLHLWDLRGFPVSDVRNMKTGENPGLTRTQSAWEFLLLLRLIDALQLDQSIKIVGTQFDRIRQVLVDQGLLAGDWKARVFDLTKATFKLPLPYVEASAEFTGTAVHLFQLTEIIKTSIHSLTITNNHVLALDGLDTLLFETDGEYESLAGLIHAVESLNRLFSTMPLFFVAALRSDIYNVLPSPDTNKFLDSAVMMDWSERMGRESELWKMLAAKAQVDHPNLPDLVRTYLSERIQAGRRWITTADYILDFTRYLPRDVVASLNELAKTVGANEPQPNRTSIPHGTVRKAVTTYCEQYFTGEVFNNLAGILEDKRRAPRKVAALQDALRSLPSRFFDYGYLKEELDGILSEEELTLLLRQLFDIGAIGLRSPAGQGESTDFVYRKGGAGGSFTRRRRFVLHNALTVAWNRSWVEREA